MNIFVAGVHGVGKTYLASRLPASLDLMATSASKLIKEELSAINWGADKRVSDVEGNQVALARSIKRHNGEGRRLLIDGHFVLLGPCRELVRLDAPVFRALVLSGVVLIEAEPGVIAARLRERDGGAADMEHVRQFVAAERAQGQLVCNELKLPMIVLTEPSVVDFLEAVTALSIDA